MSEDHVCSALRSLIEDCTVILGWCYTTQEVEDTKEKQKDITEKAIKKIFPDFEVEHCFNTAVPTAEVVKPSSNGLISNDGGTLNKPGVSFFSIISMSLLTVLIALNGSMLNR